LGRLRPNTPNWGQRLPGFHYAGAEPDAFAPLPEVIAYLEGYAASFAAPVREDVDVTGVRRRNGAFVVETSDGELDAGNVVVAAGAYQSPTPSTLSEHLSSSVFQLHTRDYKRPDQLPDGGVLIVGSGQSGCQIADELLDTGRSVYLSVGRCQWLPRRYRGRELLHWLLETGLADDQEAIKGEVVRLGDGLEQSLASADEFVANKRRVDEYASRPSSGRTDIVRITPGSKVSTPTSRAGRFNGTE
jgi:putative flavoprotein involved in K+ transport